VPADSPLTEFNETELVDPTLGYRGCNDYIGWGLIISRLASKYPSVKAVNIDDFGVDPGKFFTESYTAGIRDALHSGQASGGPVVKLVPTFYYDTDNGQPGGSKTMVLTHFPWLIAVTDGALLYFQNRKGGQDVCATSPLCGADPPRSYWACLWDTCAEASVARGLPSEIADFAAAMEGSGNELHVGLYFDGYGSEPGRATPSVGYDSGALASALANPAVSGVAVYTFQAPRGPCPNEGDRGCIVKSLFGNTPSPSSFFQQNA
jgi:hypothetical protein